jgi:hypothetical protein
MRELRSKCQKLMAVFFFGNMILSAMLIGSLQFVTTAVSIYLVFLIVSVIAVWMPAAIGYVLWFRLCSRRNSKSSSSSSDSCRPAVRDMPHTPSIMVQSCSTSPTEGTSASSCRTPTLAMRAPLS